MTRYKKYKNESQDARRHDKQHATHSGKKLNENLRKSNKSKGHGN